MDLENESQGWIKIHRKLLDEPFFSSSEHVHLWIYLLLRANHKPRMVSDVVINRGQVLTGRNKLSESTGIGSSKVERILSFFESEQLIEQQTTNKFRIITIKKYNEYQKVDSKADNSQQQPTTTNNSDTAKNTNNNDNNGENEKNGKKKKYIHLENFPSVKLTQEEYDKLKDRFNGNHEERIENLYLYIKSKGDKYKSHYATILMWEKKDEKGRGLKDGRRDGLHGNEEKGVGRSSSFYK